MKMIFKIKLVFTLIAISLLTQPVNAQFKTKKVSPSQAMEDIKQFFSKNTKLTGLHASGTAVPCYITFSDQRNNPIKKINLTISAPLHSRFSSLDLVDGAPQRYCGVEVTDLDYGSGLLAKRYSFCPDYNSESIIILGEYVKGSGKGKKFIEIDPQTTDLKSRIQCVSIQ